MRVVASAHSYLRAAAFCGVFVIAATACSRRTPVLTGIVDAHDAMADLQVQFGKAVDASNRAVMADTDETSAAAAHEAEQATQAAQADVTRLRPLLRDLQFTDELHELDAFDGRFAEYRRVNRETLPLAVENTNLKAQRLLFGPCAQAVADVRTAVAALGHSQHAMNADRRDAVIAQTAAATLEIEVVLARHIAESDDAAMTRMEGQIHGLQAVAGEGIGALGRGAKPDAVAAARSALDRFNAVVQEIEELSRRNTNVRSLALALGKQRTISSQCDEHLRQLSVALSQHAFAATR